VRRHDTLGTVAIDVALYDLALYDLALYGVALYKAKDAGHDQVRLYAHASGNTRAAGEADEATDECP